MKFKGKKISKATEDYAVIERGSDKIVIIIKTVTDYEDFDKLCPLPEAPVIKPAGKPSYKDVEDEGFKEEVALYAYKRLCWSFFKSIEDSDDLEFSNVNPSDSETWENVITELAGSLSEGEIDFIMGKYNEVQGLTNDKIKQSTDSFLAGLVKAEKG